MEERDLLIVGGALLLALLLVGGGGMMGFGIGFMMIFWVILLVIIIYGLGDRGRAKEKSAREILDERFARGEITPEEYRRMKETLGR